MKVKIFKTKIPHWDWQYYFGDAPLFDVLPHTRRRWFKILSDYKAYQSELGELHKKQNESVD